MQISYLVTMEQALNFLSNQGLTSASNIHFENNIKLYRTAAHKKICHHLGYEIIESTYENEIHTSKGGYYLFTNHRPIISFDKIKRDGVEQDKADYTIVDNQIIFCNTKFTPGIYNYSVDYKAGWNATSMPGDIRLAALQLIALYVGQNGGAGTTIGKASISNGQGGSESIDFEAETRILNSINGYRRYDRL